MAFFCHLSWKRACDGVGGSVKRLAARASLQRPYDQQITTPRQLFEWAVENIPAVVFKYCTLDDYKKEQVLLEERFQQSRTIPGTRKLDSFVPLTRSTPSTKVYSSSTTSKAESVTVLGSELDIEQIRGFVTCVYQNQWWVACTIQLDEENIKVSFLHPHGPSRSFRYPSTPEILTIPIGDILTKVDPKSRGRMYTLTQEENRVATDKLKLRAK